MTLRELNGRSIVRNWLWRRNISWHLHRWRQRHTYGSGDDRGWHFCGFVFFPPKFRKISK